MTVTQYILHHKVFIEISLVLFHKYSSIIHKRPTSLQFQLKTFYRITTNVLKQDEINVVRTRIAHKAS